MDTSQNSRPAVEFAGQPAQPSQLHINNLPVVIKPGDPLGDAALELLQQMRTEAVRRYGHVIATSAPPTNEPVGFRGAFLLARFDSQIVGCAALRSLTNEVAEVKRMYVHPSVRRHGIGRLLLTSLEAIASGFGYRTVRLETGVRQPEAIALYESRGFHRILGYGDHVADPLSICFEKHLPN